LDEAGLNKILTCFDNVRSVCFVEPEKTFHFHSYKEYQFLPSVFDVLGGFNALPIIDTCSRCPLTRKNALPLRIS